jgi:hypothetical protein
LSKAWIILFSLFFVTGYGQKLSVNYSSQSLTSVLNSLSVRYNLKIAFDTQVADKIWINKSINKATIDEALSILTEGTGLKVQRMGEVYMIIPDAKGQKKEFSGKSENGPVVVTKGFIYGLVKDKISGESLPFASIYVSKNHLGTTTNSDGYFRLEMSAGDSIYYVVNYIGYAPLTCKAMPQAIPVLQTIFLEVRTEQLQTIEVRDNLEVFDNSGTNVERIKFSPSKMNNIPSLTELDIMAPLQMLPGINATNENAGGFSIHNSQPDKTLMIYDGMTLYHMNHFFGAFSSIHTKAVKDIQVYKNGFGPSYGGSTSGIIEITGKSGNMQKPVIDVGVDMLAADAKVEVPIVKNKGSFLFSGRRSFTDVLKTPLYNQMFENARYDFNSYYRKPPKAFTSQSDDPAYYYDDANAKLTFRPSPNSVLSVSGFRSADKLMFYQRDIFPKMVENTHWGTQGAGIRWAGNMLRNWSSKIVLGVSKTSFNYTFGDSILKKRNKITGTVDNFIAKSTVIDSWLNNISLTWDNTLDLGQDQAINAGLTVQSFNSVYDYSAQTYYNEINLQDTSRNYHNKAKLFSSWIQYQLSGERWQVKPGVRFNKYSIINKLYPEFRFSAAYKIHPSVTLKTQAGNYVQFVNKINLSKQGDYRSAWAISDGDKYPVVSSYSVSFGLNYAITTTLGLDVDLYYKKTDHLTTSMEEYRVYTNMVRIGKSRLFYNSKVKGVDVLLKQTIGNYQLWVAYTLSGAISQWNKNDKELEYPSDNDQTHELKLLHLLKLKNWVFSFSSIYGSGIVWDEYILNDNLKMSKEYQKNNVRVPAYLRFDGGVNYAFHLGAAEVKIGSNFFNIFDHKNVIQRFDKFSATPRLDIEQGINPLEETSVDGLGFSWNFFVNLVF